MPSLRLASICFAYWTGLPAFRRCRHRFRQCKHQSIGTAVGACGRQVGNDYFQQFSTGMLDYKAHASVRREGKSGRKSAHSGVSTSSFMVFRRVGTGNTVTALCWWRTSASTPPPDPSLTRGSFTLPGGTLMVFFFLNDVRFCVVRYGTRSDASERAACAR